MRRSITLFLAIFFMSILATMFYSFADVPQGQTGQTQGGGSEERIILTTYYPAPYGVYTELRSDQMSIGSAYRNLQITDGNLIVSGNVGVGTSSPSGIFEVSGGISRIGAGKNITLEAESAALGSNANGGNIIFIPGEGDGTGSGGNIIVGAGIVGRGLSMDVTGSLKVKDEVQQVKLFETDSSDVQDYFVVERQNEKFGIGSYDDSSARFTPVLTANMNGNVGIGTTQPQGKLAVSRDGINSDLIIDSTTGNVGIGTTASTNRKLEVLGSIGSSEIYLQNTSPSGFGVNIIMNNASNNGDAIKTEVINGQGDLYRGIQKGTGDLINIASDNWSNIMFQITKSGNVGIGITANTGTKLRVESGSETGVYSTTSGLVGKYGVFGYATAGATGVKGQSNSGYGLQGESTTSRGVSGKSSSNYGVYADSDTGTSLYVDDTAGIGQYSARIYGDAKIWGDLYLTGISYNNQQYFIQPHPRDPTKQIDYIQIEGRDHRVFFDGTTKLNNGEAIIQIPEDFRYVASEKNPLNVILTSYGETQIYVKERSLEKIIVKSREGEDVEFGFLVIATRGGFEKSQPIQENTFFKTDEFTTIEQFENIFKLDENDLYYDKLRKELNRKLLTQNGILTNDGKLNMDLVKRLGWKYDKEKALVKLDKEK